MAIKRTTIKDVARAAGFSVQTVSRALNNKDYIQKDTRSRILAEVERLHYRPSRVAQSFVTRRTYSVGLRLGDLGNPFFADVLLGVQAEAAKSDYTILLNNTNPEQYSFPASLSLMSSQGVDGLIIFMTNATEAELVDFVERNEIPVVVVNEVIDQRYICPVWVDTGKAASTAVGYLLDHGRTAVGMLANINYTFARSKRVRGYRNALESRGLPVREDWILGANGTLEDGFLATKKLLSGHPEINALFTFNDLMAVGAIRACWEMGRRIPADCAIMGFDNLPIASVTIPSLSTVGYDRYDLGRRAMERLHAMIENPGERLDPVELDSNLVIREST